MHRFHGQSLLHPQAKTRCQQWQPAHIGSFRLETHPALPVVPIRAGGCRIGVFLGYPISPQQEYLPPVAWVSPGLELSRTHAIEDWLYAWRGRWVAIIHTPALGTRLYLDAIGSMSCVYSPTHGFCASSPLLYPDVSRDDELIRTYGMPASGRFYPAGLTPFEGVTRLLPNHYLDLDKMTTHRHWPLRSFKRPDDTDTLTSQIGSHLRDNIQAVAKDAPTYLSLTAGRDSRMLLAAARDVLDNIEFFTYDDAPVDIHISRKIAKQQHLAWQALPPVHASAEDMAQWQDDAGHCVAGSIWKHSPRFAGLKPGRIRMPGLGGEIGRSFYWRPLDRADSTLTSADLLQRMKLPTDDTTNRAMEMWSKSLPAWLDTYDVLDLAYIEHRLGCWAGPALYGSDEYFAGQLVPFADRYLIERMLSLPPDYRATQRMAGDLISRAWPELLECPFNQYTGWRRYGSREGLRHYARQAKRAVRRLSSLCELNQDALTLPGRWEKEHMKNTIFLDMEACDADYGEHCGEKPTLGIAIGGYFFYTDGRMQWCDEDSLEDTVRELVNDEPLIVSFHGESFDYPLLRGVLRARGDRFKPLAFWRSDPIGKLERDLNALDATAAKLSQEDIFKARDLFEAVKSFDGFVDIRGDVNDLISHARAGVRRV